MVSLALAFATLVKQLRQARQERGLQGVFYLIPDQVFVLVPEASDSVLDIFGGVPDEEERGGEVEVGGGKGGVLLVLVPELGDEGGVVGRGDGAPLVEQVEDAELLVIDELEHRHVVGVRNALELMGKALALEQLALVLEDLGEVDLMQALVGVVNEQLLETVAFEYLEPVDIQKP